MAATTTVKVHRRKTPSAARRDETIAETRERLEAAVSLAKSALPRRKQRIAVKVRDTAAPEQTAAVGPEAGPYGKDDPSAAQTRGSETSPHIVVGPAGSIPPTPASRPAADLLNPIRPATSRPFSTADGAFQADPLITARARRGSYALEAPSWRSFRSYVTDRSAFDELRAVGLAATMRSHRNLALVMAAVGLTVLLAVAVVGAYLMLAPATADADSPYATADVAELVSTPASQWKAGEIPSLYQSDPAWGSLAYGQTTMANAGGAPTALAMAYVAVTGRDDKTPADFAQWGTEHDLTASGADTVQAFLTKAAADFGLALNAIDADDHSLRRAIVSNIPVLIVTEPDTFSPVASVVVLDDIDRDSRIVLHDPTSAARTNKSWAFNDITDAAIAAYEVRTA